MIVYRIALTRWTEQLTASGNAARWNSKGRFLLYTAASRALACLENVVHRSGEGLNGVFRVMVIDVPDDLLIDTIDERILPNNWPELVHYIDCQTLGDQWLSAGTSAVLKVPSALIPLESNYLLNPNHPSFSRIHLLRTEPFAFDSRLFKPG